GDRSTSARRATAACACSSSSASTSTSCTASILKCPSPTNLARLGGFRKRGKSATWACRRSRWVRSSGPGRSCRSSRSRTAIAPPTASTRASSTTARSEEHTSELQSRGHLVCRLLLEKKKKIQKDKPNNTQKK